MLHDETDCVLVIWSRQDGTRIDLPFDSVERATVVAKKLSKILPTHCFTVSYQTCITFEHYGEDTHSGEMMKEREHA